MNAPVSCLNRISSRPGVLVRRAAFTLIELLVVITVIAILAGLVLPALHRSKQKAEGIVCLNNNRQLALAWLLYADDHNGRLAYNLGGQAGRRTMTVRTNLNWVNNVLDWELTDDNTNVTTLSEAALGRYASGSYSIYRCPSDRTLSQVQRAAGWQARVRSYSMNAMVGDAGELSTNGFNVNNPHYSQFFSLSSIPRPMNIFVFLDEHPDSVNDGYFVNRAYSSEWTDLPGSFHNGACSLSFADGHSEIHRWQSSEVKRAPRPDSARLPFPVSTDGLADFDWLEDRMSIKR
jgi:prepilin-type N-terminal cleavage/methylation domain-containing protein/prepilin-type processing-associated H-X9-DG protein